MGSLVEKQLDIGAQHALYLKNLPTTLRRCLGCEYWMRSTGADHRVCNSCKGVPGCRDDGSVGSRGMPTRGRSSMDSGASEKANR